MGGERSRSGNVGGEFVYGKISLDKNSCAATWMCCDVMVDNDDDDDDGVTRCDVKCGDAGQS